MACNNHDNGSEKLKMRNSSKFMIFLLPLLELQIPSLIFCAYNICNVKNPHNYCTQTINKNVPFRGGETQLEEKYQARAVK